MLYPIYLTTNNQVYVELFVKALLTIKFEPLKETSNSYIFISKANSYILSYWEPMHQPNEARVRAAA